MTPITNIPAEMTVTKGCRAKGISKGETARNIEVHPVEGCGYRVHFTILGRLFILWAQSSARFAGGKFSLNAGDPTQRVVLQERA